MPNRLLIATNNPGKRLEILALLQGRPIEILTPAELNLPPNVEENGQSYAENAALKAEAFCQLSGLMTLADDSGLEVDALGSAPGIHSARYAPQPSATDADRRAYLLQQLQGKPRPWTAHFHCTVALKQPNTPIQFVTGECYGEIIPEERGQNGFGYDPIFYLPELQRCMAELSMAEKNRISHRARALLAIRPILEKIG
jgi:XTP/dITP diphosphohydrolase